MNSDNLKYVGLVSSYLRNFKHKKEGVWNFACPLCGDSNRDKTKARGYLINHNNSLIYKCHNCNVSLSFYNFLKAVDPTLHMQYAFETKKTTRHFYSDDTHKPQIKLKEQEKISLPTLYSLQNDHPAKQYAKKRLFTLKHLQRLYYVENMRDWVSHHISKEYPHIKNDQRILIPCYNADGQISGIQGRALDPNEPLRYVNVKKDTSEYLYFGLNTWNKNELTYVVEGALDSLFLPNALASNNASLYVVADHFVDATKMVFVYDNEPRNRQICQAIKKTILKGLPVVIWPQTLEHKDINEMIINKISVIEMLPEITYTGLKANIVFDNWKKC